MNIREASMNDLIQIENLYDVARSHMVSEKNFNQWNDKTEFMVEIQEYIKQSKLRVVIENQEVVGIYALIYGEDPTYSKIIGQWENNEEYVTIHKMAVKYFRKHIASYILENIILEIKNKNILNIRIDTHKDNLSMNMFLKKEGFIDCGIISIKNDFNDINSLRKAYLKIV